MNDLQPQSIYVHIPFCARKCLYCDFTSYPGREAWFEPYVRALRKEIRLYASRFPNVRISTIYLGGGTPNLLPVDQLIGILEEIRCSFDISPEAEISTEANPAVGGEIGVWRRLLQNFGTECSSREVPPVRERFPHPGPLPEGEGNRRVPPSPSPRVSFAHSPPPPLSPSKEAGFNRLSLGVQSFCDRELELLGRLHNAGEAVEAFRAAREAGFVNISIDLMYGIPEQTMESWQGTLARALELSPEHVSLYSLTVEEGTLFSTMHHAGKLELPGNDVEGDMYEEAIRTLTGAGYEHYEISNFARPGYQCRHNLTYWRNEPYFGFGAGATSFLKGVRALNTTSLEDYIDRIESGDDAVESREQLTGRESIGETMFLGLRMLRGVDEEAFTRRYGESPWDVFPLQMADLIDKGLIVEKEGFVRLTHHGLLFANDVFAEFV